MGKSTITGHFRALGFPVFDADAAVHRLYGADGGAVGPVGNLFPDAIINGAVCRQTLASKVLNSPESLKLLEDVVHPLVAAERKAFFETAQANGNIAVTFLIFLNTIFSISYCVYLILGKVVYDIPLLLENPSKHKVDYIVVATASSETQKKRVMARPGMTETKFQSILSKQLPDEKKSNDLKKI